MHVRIRRDAEEQLVLAHVVNRLSNLINLLTVQVFKDDWTRASAYQIISDTSLMSKLPTSAAAPVRLPYGNTDSNSLLNSAVGKVRSPLNIPQLPYPNVASVGGKWGAPTPTSSPGAAGVGPSIPQLSKSFTSAHNPSYVPPVSASRTGAPQPVLAQTYGVDLQQNRTSLPPSLQKPPYK